MEEASWVEVSVTISWWGLLGGDRIMEEGDGR